MEPFAPPPQTALNLCPGWYGRKSFWFPNWTLLLFLSCCSALAFLGSRDFCLFSIDFLVPVTTSIVTTTVLVVVVDGWWVVGLYSALCQRQTTKDRLSVWATGKCRAKSLFFGRNSSAHQIPTANRSRGCDGRWRRSLKMLPFNSLNYGQMA